MKFLLFTFLLSSCAFFRNTDSLHKIDPNKLIESVKLTGEGKGRLTIGSKSYVFSLESFLSKDNDWTMAVAIPFQGEEILTFHDMVNPQMSFEEKGDFEMRIQGELARLHLDKKPLSSLIKEMRSIIRFILAPSLKINKNCDFNHRPFSCHVDGEEFLISVTDHQLQIIKEVSGTGRVQLIAENLSENFFKKNTIDLQLSHSSRGSSTPFRLEFFW